MKKLFYRQQVIETFIFDLDGTAFGYNDCVASINSEGKVLAFIRDRFPHLTIQELYQLSQSCMNVDRKKWFLNLLLKLKTNDPNLGSGLELDSFAADLETLYWVTFTQLNTPYFDFIYFLEEIGSFCKLAVITDGYIKNQKIKIFSSGLHRYFHFDHIVFSDEINAKKPSREIFDYAQKKIDYQPETTAYIGDLLDKDIEGANNSGLLSIFLKRGPNIADLPKTENQIPRISITNYYELLKLLTVK
ncbi:MAG TPA: HAD family hydrolase [Bacillota bacterium]|nr:HAD family hydrolase [Bacillota bacterium]